MDTFNLFVLRSPYAVSICIIAAILLLIALVLIAKTEAGFQSLTASSKANIEKSKDKKARVLLRLLSNPERLLAVHMIAATVCKIAIFVLSLFISFSIFQPLGVSVWILVAVTIITISLIILWCEIVPKVSATNKSQKFLLAVTYWIYALDKVFAIIAIPFYKVVLAFNKKYIANFDQLSVNDLTEAIENASDSRSDEEDILKGIVKFGNIDVSEILRPRIDVVAVDLKMSIKQVLAVVVESGYSRIPVYAGNFDNVKGILFVKDLLPHISEKENFRWQSLIRPPYFVPDTKKVKELLTEFQTSKIHMAVIVDEYGGTLGIVTLEDILEEIVGEISDESDEDEKQYVQINENTYIFDGKILLNDFYKILQTETDVFEEVKGDADTLAGLILELKGAIPLKNEQIKYQQFIFKMESVDARRIKQIRVTITN